MIFSIKYRKNFTWQGKKAKIKHRTLCNGYKKGGIKKCWLKKYVNKYAMFLGKKIVWRWFHDWKVIPLFLIGKHLGKNFKFHNWYKQWHSFKISIFLPKYFHKIDEYSSLPNRRGARNKRDGGKDEPFLISVVPGISVVVGKMSHF